MGERRTKWNQNRQFCSRRRGLSRCRLRLIAQGDIPAWPLMTRDRVWRATPKTLAPSVTLRRRGSRQPSLMEWPGRGGFFMGMLSSLLAVVHQINVERVTVNKAENDRRC